MKRLQIDFAPPSMARDWHRAGRRGALLLLAGLLLCGGAAAVGARMLTRQHAFDAQLAALQAGSRKAQAALVKPAAISSGAAPMTAAQAAAINGAILQLNLPWAALRDAVGAATPASVALLALEPDPRRRSLKITAETKDAEGMVAYVEQLKRQELFGDVVLLRHEINETDPNRPLRFELDAPWRGR
jgi:hypothetical protein